MLTLPATSKTLEGRLDLQSRFQDKKTLAATHFHKLIDSTLNKLDDRFYGVWKEGPYPKDAVVYDDASGFLWKAKKDICSKKPPSQDLDNWESATYELQQEVKALQKELIQLRQFVILLGIGLSAIIFWWLVVAIYHLLVGLL
jgi:hypothetical protein